MVKFNKELNDCTSSGDGIKLYPIAKDTYNVGAAYLVQLNNIGKTETDEHKELIVLLRQHDYSRCVRQEMADFLETQPIVIAG